MLTVKISGTGAYLPSRIVTNAEMSARIGSTLSYVIMGWVAILAIMPLARALQGPGTMWLVLGGGLYTLGCVFYLWRSLPYSHMVWHLFVLAGTISHFFCILWHVMA